MINNEYVIKNIDTNKMTEEQSLKALEEINIHGRCDSPYIVKYFDSFVDDQGQLNIVLEYWDNSDLHTYLISLKHYLKEEQIWSFFIQIMLGVNHLHSQHMLHRDLKSLNIFLTGDNRIRIGDLGSATHSFEDNGVDGKWKHWFM